MAKKSPVDMRKDALIHKIQTIASCILYDWHLIDEYAEEDLATMANLCEQMRALAEKNGELMAEWMRLSEEEANANTL